MTPRELAAYVGGAFGVSPATALQIDRKLADAGIRSSFGRGNSARRATAEDAAAIIIAIAAAPLLAPAVANTADTIDKYFSLPYEDQGLVRPIFDAPFALLAGLNVDHTLSQALASLIDALASDEIPARTECMVQFTSPWPSAEIAIHGEKAWGGRYAALMDDADHTRWKAWCARMAREHGTGLFVTRTVSNGNLREIAAALRGAA